MRRMRHAKVCHHEMKKWKTGDLRPKTVKTLGPRCPAIPPPRLTILIFLHFSITPTSLHLVPISRPPRRLLSVWRKPTNLPSQPKVENGFLAVPLDHLAQGLSRMELCLTLCRTSMLIFSNLLAHPHQLAGQALRQDRLCLQAKKMGGRGVGLVR